MEVEYKKDIRHNYMIIRGMKEDPLNTYSIKLLEHQKIEGIISLEKKVIDNNILYYYEITGKQSLEVILSKDAYQYKMLQTLCLNIIKVLEEVYEYLLREEDLILNQEHIYMDIISKEFSLCYLPEYGHEIKEQICSLMEFLMNKVDYNDREAVLLVYQLYSISREESFSLEQMLQVLHSNTAKILNKEAEASEVEKRDLVSIPVMKEKIVDEEEVACYSIKAYLYAGISFLLIIAAIIIVMSSKLLFNKYANQYDYTKLIAFILLLLCVEGYVTSKIFDKKKRITKLKRTCSYIDPRMVGGEETNLEINPREVIDNKILTEQKDMHIKKDIEDMIGNREQEEEDINPTCVLNDSYLAPAMSYLKAIDGQAYKDIVISSVPFFIGKLKKNVDYCLEKDGISRFHAKITKEGEKYYITDLNSTNGTFINNEALQTYQKKEIKNGDKIAFANIEYNFIK
ncbi:MAG: DUF6382 domain-containing protein [Mobilitalea sp.]